ncbi:MAG: sugar ABC transporter substrate-binding protein [Actinocatenispora sp.]
MRAGATLSLGALGAGCGAGDTDPKSISVLTVQDPFFFAVQRLLPEFERQTGITVRLEGLDYDTLNARTTNAFITRQNNIDVVSPDSMWLSRWANSGWLTSLNDLIARDRDDVAPHDFIPNTIHSLSEWNGHIYTLPAAAYSQVALYRTDVFDQLGLARPPERRADPDWTWDRYLSDIRAIDGRSVNGTRMHGTVVAGSGPQPILHMYSQLAASNGARWFRSFPGSRHWDFTPQLDSAANRLSLRMFHELYTLSSPAAVNYVWFDAGTAFSSGTVGMFYWWSPYIRLVTRTTYMGTGKSPVVGKYAAAPLPQRPGHPQTVSIGGYAFGISRYSTKRESCWEFIKWVSSAETQKKMAMLSNSQFADFARESLYRDPEITHAYPFLDTQLRGLREGDGKAVRPPSMNYTTIEGYYGRRLNQVLAGQDSVTDALHAVQRKVTETMTIDGFLPWPRDSYPDTVEHTRNLLLRLSGRSS